MVVGVFLLFNGLAVLVFFFISCVFTTFDFLYFFVSIYFERSLWLEWELIKVGENEGRGIVPGRKDEGGGKKKLRKFIW